MVIEICSLNDIRNKTDTFVKRKNILTKLGILVKNVPCPKEGCTGMLKQFKCSTNKRYNIDKGWCLSCNMCSYQTSLRFQSPFYKSQKSLEQIIDLLYSFSVLEVGSGEGALISNVQRKNVAKWFKKFRIACGVHMQRNITTMGGLNSIVEIDESLFQKKRKYNRGRGRTNGKWVFGIIERHTGKIFFVVVPDRKRATLRQIIKSQILPHTTIYSDDFRSYWFLAEEPENYQHHIINHSAQFSDGNIHTNMMEGMWYHAKKYVKKMGSNNGDLQSYLDMFMFRKQFMTVKKNNFHIIGRTYAKYWRTVEQFNEN